MRRIAIIHPDPKMQSLADDLVSGWPPRRNDPLGIPVAVRQRKTEVVFPVTDEMLMDAAGSDENLARLRALQIGSFMTVPLVAHDHLLGAITYVSPNHGDSFAEHDKVLAGDLAARCAMAIENSQTLEKARSATTLAQEAMKRAGEAQTEAERANMVKMRFLSTMSHELRTPLNAIAGYAELLETGVRGPLTALQLRDVERIHAAEQHLLSLVDSVLDYAKIEAGRAAFGLEDVLLGNILAEVDMIISPLVTEKHIDCIGCKATGTPNLKVYADPDKLKQVLLNLLGNAIKFTPEGGSITVNQDVRNEKVQIQIKDTGIGIAPEDQKAIFEPFVQVEGGISRPYGGTGLGLAISRELAIGMGGQLTVSSTLGHGSTFTLTLSQGRS